MKQLLMCLRGAKSSQESYLEQIEEHYYPQQIITPQDPFTTYYINHEMDQLVTIYKSRIKTTLKPCLRVKVDLDEVEDKAMFITKDCIKQVELKQDQLNQYPITELTFKLTNLKMSQPLAEGVLELRSRIQGSSRIMNYQLNLAFSKLDDDFGSLFYLIQTLLNDENLSITININGATISEKNLQQLVEIIYSKGPQSITLVQRNQSRSRVCNIPQLFNFHYCTLKSLDLVLYIGQTEDQLLTSQFSLLAKLTELTTLKLTLFELNQRLLHQITEQFLALPSHLLTLNMIELHLTRITQQKKPFQNDTLPKSANKPQLNNIESLDITFDELFENFDDSFNSTLSKNLINYRKLARLKLYLRKVRQSTNSIFQQLVEFNSKSLTYLHFAAPYPISECNYDLGLQIPFLHKLTQLSYLYLYSERIQLPQKPLINILSRLPNLVKFSIKAKFPTDQQEMLQISTKEQIICFFINLLHFCPYLNSIGFIEYESSMNKFDHVREKIEPLMARVVHRQASIPLMMMLSQKYGKTFRQDIVMEMIDFLL